MARDDHLSIGWEKAVLGTALASPDTMSEAQDLRTADFTGCHRDLWAEMMVLHRRGALELRALVEALRQRNLLERIGSTETEATGEAYLAELLASRGDAMGEYVSRVLDNSIKRQLRQVAALIRAEADSENTTADEALDQAERRLLALRRNRLAQMGIAMADLMGVFTGRVDQMRAGSFQPAWVPTLDPLRRILGFVEGEDFVIAAARPGEGKSSLMRWEMVQGALNGVPGTIFNMENSEIEYARYAIAMVTGIDSSRLRDARLLTPEEVQQVREAALQLQSIPLQIVTLSSPSALEIERIARQHIARYGTKIIGIDYLQLIKNGIENKVADVSESSGVLRSIALRYGVPVWANSQMSRNIVHRGQDAEPELADLRESGAIEQDATIVLFPRALWQAPSGEQLRMFPENVDPATGHVYPITKAIPVKVYIKKNRNGPMGTTDPFLWVKSTNVFRPLTNPHTWANP